MLILTCSVRNLSNVLRDVDDVVSQRDLTLEQKQSLLDIAQGCRKILERLNVTLERYQDVDSTAKSMSGRARRVWKKLKWDQESIDQFRSQITLNISAFDVFLGQITR
jgi:hypothetical protein